MRYFEDINVGDIFEFGSYTVSQKEIINFASMYDPQVFHTDPISAQNTNVGSLIASGWHTCAIFMRMFVDNYLEGGNGMPSPGVDQLHWLRPVLPNDTLSVRVTVKKIRRSKSQPNKGIVSHFCEVINQKNDLVLTMITNGFVPVRNEGELE